MKSKKRASTLYDPAPVVLKVQSAAKEEFGCRLITHLNAEATLDAGLVQVEETDGTFTNAAWSLADDEVRFKEVTTELTREDADADYDDRCIAVITENSSVNATP